MKNRFADRRSAWAVGVALAVGGVIGMRLFFAGFTLSDFPLWHVARLWAVATLTLAGLAATLRADAAARRGETVIYGATHIAYPLAAYVLLKLGDFPQHTLQRRRITLAGLLALMIVYGGLKFLSGRGKSDT